MIDLQGVPVVLSCGMGSYELGNDGAVHTCVMSAAVARWRLAQGEPMGEATDEMDCACPVLRVALIVANDADWWDSDAERTSALGPWVDRIAGTRSDEATTLKRMFRLVDAVKAAKAADAWAWAKDAWAWAKEAVAAEARAAEAASEAARAVAWAVAAEAMAAEAASEAASEAARAAARAVAWAVATEARAAEAASDAARAAARAVAAEASAVNGPGQRLAIRTRLLELLEEVVSIGGAAEYGWEDSTGETWSAWSWDDVENYIPLDGIRKPEQECGE